MAGDNSENSSALELALRLEIDHDGLEVRLVVEERGGDSVWESAQVKDLLRDEKIFSGVDEEQLNAAFDKLSGQTGSGEVYVIARGRKPVFGKDGWIDFKVGVTGRPVYRGGVVDADADSIDFKEATQITMVVPGAEIAELHPPTEGVEGLTLQGTPLPTRPGKAIILRPGEGIEVDAGEQLFTATQAGRPVFSAGTLSVSSVFEVMEDVDFETGNINFNGHVIVRGNVQDEFSIECKSAEIIGVVGACTIKCSESLVVASGINGRDVANITVGGNCKAKYINQASLTVLGDLVVAREVVNSRIWCRGAVRATKMIGGDCLALGGVEVAIAGSELGVATTIEPGINFEVRRLGERIEKIDLLIENMLRPIEPMFGNRQKYKNLPTERKENIDKVLAKFLKLKEAHRTLYDERYTIMESAEFAPVKQVVVRHTLFPDVVVRTENCIRKFKAQQTGPIALVEDFDAGTIRVRTYNVGTGVVEDDDDESA